MRKKGGDASSRAGTVVSAGRKQGTGLENAIHSLDDFLVLDLSRNTEGESIVSVAWKDNIYCLYCGEIVDLGYNEGFRIGPFMYSSPGRNP